MARSRGSAVRTPEGRTRAARAHRWRAVATPTPADVCRASALLLEELAKQLLVGVRDSVPGIVCTHPVKATAPLLRHERRILQEPFENAPEAGGTHLAMVAEACVADGFQILRSVVHHHTGACRHSLENRRM